MSSVSVHHVEKSYGSLKVLKGVDLKIENGKFVTLLGPSGCGKSTLLRCIAGLEKVDGGFIAFDGIDVTHLPVQDRRIGMVFQNYALFPNLTVFENIAFGLKVKKMPAEVILKEVSEMIALVALEGKENAYPHQLSGGQKQRVALARALVTRPDILLLDEPLSALDAKIRKSLRLQIRNIQKQLGITTIFVTHDQEEALILSDEIVVMSEGEMIQKGNAKSIYSEPESDFVAGFIGHYNNVHSHVLKGFDGLEVAEGHYVLRPEVIKLSALQAPALKGVSAVMEVVDVIVMGSTLRYVVKDKLCEIAIDTLNDEEAENYQKGDFVRVSFAKEKLKRIG